MKNLFLSSLFLFTVIFSIPAESQEKDLTRNNYVVLTNKVPQITPIILTAEALAEEDGKNFGDFQIIICGSTVKNLTEEEKMKPYISKAEKAGVKIVVCGFSLNKFGIKTEELPKEFKVVENGILYD
ncbi:MAG TPA: DsrE family protein, partial [Salinimicrobium sp.]|nr:DsrE family protein [Salinimicrobium sp.]